MRAGEGIVSKVPHSMHVDADKGSKAGRGQAVHTCFPRPLPASTLPTSGAEYLVRSLQAPACSGNTAASS